MITYLQSSQSKKICSSLEEETMKSASASASLSQQDMEMSLQLQRDAVEQYLFMTEFINQCGALWSPVIVAMYCYGFFLIFLFIFLASAHNFIWTFNAEYLLLSFQTFLFVGIPSFSLASANAAIAPVMHTFTNSSSNDYAMMGARFNYFL